MLASERKGNIFMNRELDIHCVLIPNDTQKRAKESVCYMELP